ncbi:MAG: glycosyltransferase [Roseburia sp.]|nr:glycosyltransferase [Roseburia sp.]
MAAQRKIFIVCHDMKRYMSFWKIPELEEYLRNVTIFSDYEAFQAYFHENTSVYLPMILYGSDNDCKRLERIRKEEHQYRITPQGRNTDNVLLTIAIPTRHRGNLLLKRLEHLQMMPYNAEIEIVVSKNGKGVFEEEYTKVSEIKDARIRYYDHGKDLLGYQNFQYAIEMSCGRYVMLVSDEDDVILEALEHYLGLLRDNPELSLVRARSTYQYSDITQRKYGKKGLEAFYLMFLKQNYISGMIVRRKDFVEENFSAKFAGFSDNPFFLYYTHEWWCAMLCRRGDAVEEPVILIFEGESAVSGNFPSYSTYEARLKQFRGMVEFLRFILEEDKMAVKEDKQVYEKCLQRAISKTVYLFDLARSVDHDVENYVVMLDKFAQAAVSIIEDSCLDEDQKMRTLHGLKLDCEELFTLDRELKAKERQEKKGRVYEKDYSAKNQEPV